MKDFQRDYVRKQLGVLSPDDLLKGLSPEEIKLYLKKLEEK